ncbi:MAG: hypothetical protein H0V93_16390 [Euzebyales bacterium]|nr:hypothetical protein [Euzebyales bacterium]
MARRREGKHLYYRVADAHVAELIANALAHPFRSRSRARTDQSRMRMTEHMTTHADHSHSHGEGCGHTAVSHAGHADYLVDGHLHHAHGGHCDDHGPLIVA